jgi:hypothetical protein
MRNTGTSLVIAALCLIMVNGCITNGKEEKSASAAPLESGADTPQTSAHTGGSDTSQTSTHTIRLDDYLDTSRFAVDGCSEVEVVEGVNALNCSKNGLEEKFDCESFLIAPKYYSGLWPKETILECNNPVTGICTDGILGGGCVNYHEGKQMDDVCDRIFNRI